MCLAPRDRDGNLALPPVVIGRPLSPRETFGYRCFLLGVRDPATVDRLWREGHR